MNKENTNCLEGWECPNCQEAEEFLIRGAVNVQDINLCDLGTVEVESHGTEWDPFCPCVCMKCDHEGKVWEFSPPYEEPVKIESCMVEKSESDRSYNYLAIKLNDGNTYYLDADKVADAVVLTRG